MAGAVWSSAIDGRSHGIDRPPQQFFAHGNLVLPPQPHDRRPRLQTVGRLEGHDLRKYARSGATREELVETLSSIWSRRVDRYSELRSAATEGLQKIEMSYIGG